MGTAAALLTKGQEGDLRNLIEELCLDDKECRTSLLASGFRDDIDIQGARLMVEVHPKPVVFTELYLSFPTGKGTSGMLKLFRWREAGETRVGLGASDEKEFTIKRLGAGSLRDSANNLLNGLMARKNTAGG